MFDLSKATQPELEVERTLTEEAMREISDIIDRLSRLVRLTDPSETIDPIYRQPIDTIRTANYINVLQPVRINGNETAKALKVLKEHLYHRVLEINRELRLRQLSVEGEFIK